LIKRHQQRAFPTCRPGWTEGGWRRRSRSRLSSEMPRSFIDARPHSGERFVELEEIDVGGVVMSLPSSARLDGSGGLGEERRVGNRPPMPYPISSARRGRAELFGLGPCSSRSTAATAVRRSAKRLPAPVIVPSFENAGRRAAERSVVVPGAYAPRRLSTITGSPLRCLIDTAVISSARRPSFWAAAAGAS